MRDRLISVLDHLKSKAAEGLSGSVVDYRAAGAHGFELKIDVSGKTLLKYEVGGDDEILRIEILHGFAHLDLARTNDPTAFLVELLQQNVPSFRGSGAYLGLKKEQTGLVMLMNSTRQFVGTMSNQDMAEALSIAIFDLKMARLMEFPDAVVMW